MSAPTQQILFTATPYISAPAAAFLARTSGLDTTHTNAYIALINDLISDGIWSKLDFLYAFATQDSTTAKLNLVSSSYAATLTSTPTFTADRGYTGAFTGTKALSSNFNPSTASSPQFVQNSAHLSAWSVTDLGTQSTGIIGYSVSGNEAAILPRYDDGNGYFRTNSSNSTGGGATSSSAGFFMGNRSSSSAVQAYRNGSSVMSHTSGDTSVAVQNTTVSVCGININGITQASNHQIASASGGSSMNSTEASNYYTRLRTYMTAVGVP